MESDLVAASGAIARLKADVGPDAPRVAAVYREDLRALLAIHAANGGAFIPEQKKFRASVVAAIGGVLEEDFRARGLFGVIDNAPTSIAESKVVGVMVSRGSGPDACPDCGATPLVHEQGCVRCLSCDYTKCG